MTRLALSLPPGYAPLPGPGADRVALRSTLVGSDPAELDRVLDAVAAEWAGRGIVTSGALALDGSSTAWLTVVMTPLTGGSADVVPGIVDLLRDRLPAADVRAVMLPAGPAVRVEQHGRFDLPGGRVALGDIRHLLPTSGGEEVVTVVLQSMNGGPARLAAAADRIARGVRVGDGGP